MNRKGYKIRTTSGPKNAGAIGHGNVLKSLVANGGIHMKKEELISLGITEDVANQIYAMNGRDIENAKAAKDKEIQKLTTERDDLQTRLTTAEDTLAKFGDKTPEQIQQEIQTYQKQAKDAEDNLAAKLTQRDQKDWIKAQLDEYGVKSPLARKQITAEVMHAETGLKWKDGAFLGFGDYMANAKKEDASLYQTAEEKKAAEEAAAREKDKPGFTGPAGDEGGSPKKYTPPKIF